MDKKEINMTLENELSQEVLNGLFEQYWQGSQAALNTIFIHNLKLVYSIINQKMFDVDIDADDLFQVGAIGLYKAIKSFSKGNTQFKMYAYICIRNEILRHLRSYHHCDRDISMNEYVDEKRKITYSDYIRRNEITVDEMLEQVYDYDIIRRCVSNFPRRDKLIMTMLYGFVDGIVFKQRDIGKYLEMTDAHVSKRVRYCLKKIKKMLLSPYEVALDMGLDDIREEVLKYANEIETSKQKVL